MRKLRYNFSVLMWSFLCFAILVVGLPVRAQQTESSKTTAQGIQLYQQGDARGAIKILQDVVVKHPDDADAWYYLGLAFFHNQGSIGAARSPFEHLIKLRPDSADGHAKLAYALILADKSDRALATAQRAVELGDQSAEAHYAIAEANLRMGVNTLSTDQLGLALREAETTLGLNPNFSLALITKSLAQYHLKQYSEAVTSLEQFVAISPDDIDADTWRGQLEEVRERAAIPNTTNPAAETSKTVTQKARVLTKPEPQYTEAARRAGVQGTVVLRAIFASDGEVKHLLVIRALSYGLTSRAINAARQIKFTPAMKDNRPVSMYIQLEYNFNLY